MDDSAMSIEIRVPTLGESVTEATVATWFKGPGDIVATDEMLCELETDKVTVEVRSPASGRLGEIVAAEGSTVGVDSLLATVTDSDKATAEAMQSTASPEPDPKLSTSVDVMVPALGESVTEATVSTWFKAVGDAVVQDEMLCELETDKVSIEVPAPAAGTLSEILVAEGSTVMATARLAILDSGGGQAVSATTEVKKDVEDAPSARKMMAEHGLKQDEVKGSGRDGRVMKEDVKATLASPIAETVPPAPPAAKPSTRAPVPAEDTSREERVRMTRLRQTIARRLKDAQNTAGMLTTYNEVDMGTVMDIRNEYKALFEKKHGVKMGFMSFFTKACCHALKEVPEVNAEIDGTDIVYKNFVHMGVAVGTPTGLVVPVVRNADRLGFADIEKTIAELGSRARDGKLTMAELQGGTFTLSNGGVYGSLMSSPILNPPQSGILGMHKIQQRPMVVNGEIIARPMMYLALSYDHRIVDGKGAVTFLVRVKEALEDPRRLLLDL